MSRLWVRNPGEPVEPPRPEATPGWFASLREMPTGAARREFLGRVRSIRHEVWRARREKWAWLLFVVAPTALLLTAVIVWRAS